MSFHSDGSSKSSNEFRLAHLRTGRVKSRLLSNNKDSKHLDNNFKNLSINCKKKKNIVSSGKSLTKGYVPFNKRHDFGISTYFDCKFKGSILDYKKKLEESATIYVGNLNLFSTEKDIRNQFSKAGNIKTIIMGLEQKTMSPGGFCFVEYVTHEEAENCISTMKENTWLDGYKLVIDWDAGFSEGRQYTRRKNRKFMLNYPSLQKVNLHFEHQEEDYLL